MPPGFSRRHFCIINFQKEVLAAAAEVVRRHIFFRNKLCWHSTFQQKLFLLRLSFSYTPY